MLICHCLLIETGNGLVLVDTGIGLKDISQPRRRMGALYKFTRPLLDPEETAVRQVQRLGYSYGDVRHIIVTHLDFDHAGGLADFPNAKVHIFGPEYAAAMAPTSVVERHRYRQRIWDHSPDWITYKIQGEKWFGFNSVRDLEGLPPEILLIPLTGHTLGHCGVAIHTKEGWLLHAGDAYFYHGEINPEKSHCPLSLKVFQKLTQVDGEARVHNQKRLKQLVAHHSSEVRIFSSHDVHELNSFN